VDEVKKRERRAQKKPNWRTGGVLDPGEVPPLPDPEEFAKKHEFPDPLIMEERLYRARMSLRISANAPRYRRVEVVSQFESFDEGLCLLLDGLESEPLFSAMAFDGIAMSNDHLTLLLQSCYRSLKEAEDELEAGSLPLPNSIKGLGRQPPIENTYLLELKKIHFSLTGYDRKVTFNDYADSPEDAFTGKFYEFAKDCFKLENLKIRDSTLRTRITAIHKMMENGKT
jgi:hypothetical protein